MYFRPWRTIWGLRRVEARGYRPDLRQRVATYVEAQTLFQRDMPWVPLYHVSVSTAYRREVRGLAVGATGLSRFDKVWKSP